MPISIEPGKPCIIGAMFREAVHGLFPAPVRWPGCKPVKPAIDGVAACISLGWMSRRATSVVIPRPSGLAISSRVNRRQRGGLLRYGAKADGVHFGIHVNQRSHPQ